jgi:hypothetical protein
MQGVAAVLLAGLGVFMLEMARRSRDGLIPPGSALGWRTKATARSVECWHAGQRAAAPYNVALGVAAIAAAGVLFVVGFGALAPITAGLSAIGVGASLAANRAADRVEGAADEFG